MSGKLICASAKNKVIFYIFLKAADNTQIGYGSPLALSRSKVQIVSIQPQWPHFCRKCVPDSSNHFLSVDSFISDLVFDLLWESTQDLNVCVLFYPNLLIWLWCLEMWMLWFKKELDNLLLALFYSVDLDLLCDFFYILELLFSFICVKIWIWKLLCWIWINGKKCAFSTFLLF